MSDLDEFRKQHPIQNRIGIGIAWLWFNVYRRFVRIGYPLKDSQHLSWLHALSERAEWCNWPPRAFWKWLLGRCDRQAGFYHE